MRVWTVGEVQETRKRLRCSVELNKEEGGVTRFGSGSRAAESSGGCWPKTPVIDATSLIWPSFVKAMTSGGRVKVEPLVAAAVTFGPA